MEHNSNGERGKIRGYLFEIVILHLLAKSGFTLINSQTTPRVRELRKHFIELKGRGEWHQIDCPMDCDFITPFMYPIRLLGEVKFYKDEIEKDKIREYIGVIKDIQENYFADTEIKILPQRYIEIGAFFSANGFTVEAEHLAYAHGIKTISYENNFIIDRIKKLIENLEETYIDYERIKNRNFSKFFNGLYQYFENINTFKMIPKFNRFFEVGYEKTLMDLREIVVNNIKSNFIGYSDMGFSLHFIGEEDFPYELFYEKDEAECRVYVRDYNLVENLEEQRFYFYIMFTEDKDRRKFYFTPPKILFDAAKKSEIKLLKQKRAIFNYVNINITINNIKRTLSIKIDNKWLLDLLEYEEMKNTKK